MVDKYTCITHETNNNKSYKNKHNNIKFPVPRSDLRLGHTVLYCLITAKTHQKVVSREADNVVNIDVEFKTSYCRFIEVAGRGEKSERRRTWQKVLNCSKF